MNATCVKFQFVPNALNLKRRYECNEDELKTTELLRKIPKLVPIARINSKTKDAIKCFVLNVIQVLVGQL